MDHSNQVDTVTNLDFEQYGRLFLGEGLFETMLATDGEVCDADRHWQRMKHSATELSIPFHMSLSEWQDHATKCLLENEKKAGIIKAILLPLTNERGLLAQAEQSEIIWQCHPKKMAKSPIDLMAAPWHRDSDNPIYKHKTLSYIDNIQAKKAAARLAKDDTVFFDQHGNILETTSANIFLVIGGKLFTPSLDLAILPGIRRQTIINEAANNGVECIEGRFTRDHLSQAEAVFLTNSVIGLVSVSSFETHAYNTQHEIYQLLKR